MCVCVCGGESSVVGDIVEMVVPRKVFMVDHLQLPGYLRLQRLIPKVVKEKNLKNK